MQMKKDKKKPSSLWGQMKADLFLE